MLSSQLALALLGLRRLLVEVIPSLSGLCTWLYPALVDSSANKFEEHSNIKQSHAKVESPKQLKHQGLLGSCHAILRHIPLPACIRCCNIGSAHLTTGIASNMMSVSIHEHQCNTEPPAATVKAQDAQPQTPSQA